MQKSPTEGRTGREYLEWCDRNITVKVYRTVVRPALMYRAETWALKKAQEKKSRLQKCECYIAGYCV